MSLQQALVNQVVKTILDNKDEYLSAAKDALIGFVKQIKVPGHDSAALDEIVQKLHALFDDTKGLYDLIKTLVDLYGHPEVKPTK